MKRFSFFFFLFCLSTLLSITAGESPADSSQTQPDFKNWQVDHQYGPADTVAFTLSEGTWMNLDVSPDGKTVVFDILGDIYTLPIEGGEATLLAGGLPYEVQPRFSPDGQHIAFTSDRAGGDNLWIMDADGQNAHAVTAESFRLLNNPTWTPDGQYLIGRKHFTSRRSLGAGEMWMYHRTGGSGIQLTKRKNDQQDVNEPVVSPDGRYLYFSEDMSGGSTFQYNKDPNGQIYVIRRLDLESGELENYLGGAGGAFRPQISRNGRYLSFVRRVRSKTVLYVHDLQTGENRPVYDQLTKDQQEAWAIFGVYTGYSWMPGDREIVIWANGKLRRIDVATRESREIPFTLKATHSIARAVRFPQNPHPDSFQAKMIRGAVTSPDGRWLVFNAVGQLWKKRLPDGKPERLTRDENIREFDAAFSADGKWVVYATWEDQRLGDIRRVPLGGGKSKVLSATPGYYYTPRVAPDNTLIVYRKGSGNLQLGSVYGLNPGLYWMAADGGEGNFIIDEGDTPRFNKGADRIYYYGNEGGKSALLSVTLDGQDRRCHFTSEYATEMVISPDENWVAFQELFNLYVTPFPRTGKSLDLSATNKAIPLQKISRDAGIYVHWSGDSRKLHWTIGPEYFTRALVETFDYLPGAPQELPAIDSTGTPVGLELSSDNPGGMLAISGARIITMEGDEVIENGVIVTEGNRIVAVGKSGEVEIPARATRIDASGKTIMPGLVDVHAHMWHFGNDIPPFQNWPYMANLAFGITTTHDPSTTTEVAFHQGELVLAGKMLGPRVFNTGTILYGAEGNFKAVVNSLEDARSHLRRLKAVGAFSVKSYNQPRREQRQQVIQAARELEMMVVPEGGSFFYHNMSMILDGHTGIEHNIPVEPVYQDVISLWKSSRTGYTPTLVVAYGSQSGQRYWYQKDNVWENELLMHYTPRQIVDPVSRRRNMSPEDEYGHIQNAEVCKALSDAGVKVNIGGHGEMQGLAPHWELWMLTQGGMSPMEALRSATANGAAYLGMDQHLGSLRAGKLADMIILNADPLADIRNSINIDKVMMNGRLYQAATLDELGNHPQKRQPMYWRRGAGDETFMLQQAVGESNPGCGCGRH